MIQIDTTRLARALMSRAVRPSWPSPNRSRIHSASVITCARRVHLPMKIMKNAMISTTPPRISMKNPFTPSE